MFEKRQLLIATKHQKEKVIAPAFEKAFGLNSRLAKDFDTDQFGTFSGEIERKKSPLETARAKALAALAQSNYQLVIASEGSFGPHPNIPFIACDEEFLVLIDQKHELEVSASTLSMNTNYASALVEDETSLLDFAEKALFPSHALILKVKANKEFKVIKGIRAEAALIDSYRQLSKEGKEIRVETDMRALFNPSRMKVIATATDLLIEKLRSTCPKCDTPGFWCTQKIPGLACGLCGNPTKGIKSEVWACQKCAFKEERTNPNGKIKEDPAYCDFCNP